MTSPLLAKLDAVDEAIGNSAYLTPFQAHSCRADVSALRRKLEHFMGVPERPDLAENARRNNEGHDRLAGRDHLAGVQPEHDMSEADRQAAMQSGEAPPGYPPLHKGPLGA